MGYSKVVRVSDTKLKFVHQLGLDGVAYAEDVTIEVQPGVDPARLGNIQDGTIGVITWYFSPTTSLSGPADLQFPE